MTFRRKVFLLVAGLTLAFFLATVICVLVGENESPSQARRLAVRADLEGIKEQLKVYKNLNGFYPTTEQGINALVSKPVSSPIPQRWEQLLRDVPVDPWQHRYVYRSDEPNNSREYDLFSLGPDGVESNDDMHIGP